MTMQAILIFFLVFWFVFGFFKALIFTLIALVIFYLGIIAPIDIPSLMRYGIDSIYELNIFTIKLLVWWYVIGLIGAMFWPWKFRKQIKSHEWWGICFATPILCAAWSTSMVS